MSVSVCVPGEVGLGCELEVGVVRGSNLLRGWPGMGPGPPSPWEAQPLPSKRGRGNSEAPAASEVLCSLPPAAQPGWAGNKGFLAGKLQAWAAPGSPILRQ